VKDETVSRQLLLRNSRNSRSHREKTGGPFVGNIFVVVELFFNCWVVAVVVVV
jgi:hypothetical protein